MPPRGKRKGKKPTRFGQEETPQPSKDSVTEDAELSDTDLVVATPPPQEAGTCKGPQTLTSPSASGVQTTSSAKKKQARPLKLSPEQEDVVFAFIEAHQELYSKGHPNFFKTPHKTQLWKELGSQVQAVDESGGYQILVI